MIAQKTYMIMGFGIYWSRW